MNNQSKYLCPICGADNMCTDFTDGFKWGRAYCNSCDCAGPEVRTGYEESLDAPWRTEARKQFADVANEYANKPLAEDNNVPVKQPDPITGLVPCEYCTDHKNLYDDKYTDVEMLDGFIHVDVRTQYEGWSFGFDINYCPMCGRKLTTPPRPGAIGQETGEMDPNGDEGAEL